MRRRPVLSTLVLATAVLLAGCGGSDDGGTASSPSPSASASPSGSSDAPVVPQPGVDFTASGGWGEKPTLEFGSDTAPEGLRVDVISEGDGAVVEATDFVVANYLGQVWGTDNVFDNSYDRGAPSGFPLEGVVQGWQYGLVGQHVGSRVLISIPSELGYATGNPNAGIEAGDTIVFVVDLVDTFNAESSGQADAVPTDAALPVTVTGDLGSPVTDIQVSADAVPATEPRLTVIATGTGEPIPAEGWLAAQYAVNDWDNTGLEATWAPTGFGLSELIPLGGGTAFDTVVGVPVGSRVLLELPADATTGQPAFAVVIDLLAVY